MTRPGQQRGQAGWGCCHLIPTYVLAHIVEAASGQTNAPRGDRAVAATLLPAAGRSTVIAAAQESLALTSSMSIARAARAEATRSLCKELHPLRAGISERVRAGAAEPMRTVYTAHHTERLPGIPVRRENGPPAADDVSVNEAFRYAGLTLNFYRRVFGRDSLDNRGMPINSTVHVGRHYDNAFWDGHEIIYGDGDGQLFHRFTVDVDIVAHELTHGVTAHEANLQYWKQSGALNESISDVFGSLVKQWHLGQTADEADWLIGEHLFTQRVTPAGAAIRSLKSPGHAYNDNVLGKDQQPARMRDYVHTLGDSGGVHINSGIPNHAFYLAATAIGGRTWERAGLIWYDAVRDPDLAPSAQFADFARLTIRTAGRLFGFRSTEFAAVRNAWAEVEVLAG